MERTGSSERLVVVSNRLPVVIVARPDGSLGVEPGKGGLVTALAPVLKDRGGLWIGWSGSHDERANEYLLRTRPESGVGYQLHPVSLTEDEVLNYYQGFSNEVLWPLFHDLVGRCRFLPEYWETYQRVNRKFALAVAEATTESDFVWVQDYHLTLVAKVLEQLGLRRRTGFFLHIPFPPLDIFAKLPWRFEVLEGLLAYDLVGFQTVRDRRNFIQSVRTLIPGVKTSGRGSVSELFVRGRTVRVGVFPIGIDAERFARGAASDAVAEQAWYIHEKLPDRQLVLGIDRLDYTKGIPHRLNAVAEALARHPEMRGRMTFVQVVVPSREQVPDYQEQLAEIEQLVGHVNGRFSDAGWTPVHYVYRSLDWEELLAYYRTCEIALITPLKDGMNLIAKEYCACSLDSGVLILSEFAGAAAQLQHGALIVNPFDVVGTAEALYRAFTMPHEERRARMRRLQRNVARYNVFWWVDCFLRAAISRDLSDFPPVDYFVPKPDEAQIANE